MSLMTLSPRRGGVASAPVVGVAAVLTQQGTPTTGTLRFTGGFWLPETGSYSMSEADVTAKKFSVWIGGVEQAIHAEAMRGRHPNGNVRCVRYDLDYTCASTADVVASVVIGVARGTTDISRRAITQSVSQAKRWLVATDTDFTTSTKATGMPLAKSSLWNAAETAFFTTMFDYAIFYTDTYQSGSKGAATYDPARACVSAFLCTGNITYLSQAYVIATKWMTEYHLQAGTDNNYGGTTQIDTESLGVYAVSFPEQYSLMEWSFGLAYELTGWSYYWALLNQYSQRFFCAAGVEASQRTTGEFLYRATAGDNSIRRAYRNLRWMLGGYTFDTTYAYGDADSGPRNPDWAAELPWHLDSIEYNKYDTSAGAYKVNFRGQNPAQIIASGAWSAGDFQNFAVSIVNNALIDYLENIKTDARLVGWVKINMDIVLANASELPALHYYHNNGGATSGKYATPYKNTSTAVTSLSVDGGPSGSGELNDPFDFCMHVRALAFLAVEYPSDVVNGKTYAQWRDLAMRPEQMEGMAWNWKFIGETVQAFDAPYRRIYGNPSRPATIRTPTIHTNQPT